MAKFGIGDAFSGTRQADGSYMLSISSFDQSGNAVNLAPGRLEYETVAASATDQAMGATGATGDYLSHIVIQPASTGAGVVTVKDGTTVIYTFTSGTLADLSPKTVPFGASSVNGAWKITTGANVAVVAFGDFT
jgi:hypothetical protein